MSLRYFKIESEEVSPTDRKITSIKGPHYKDLPKQYLNNSKSIWVNIDCSLNVAYILSSANCLDVKPHVRNDMFVGTELLQEYETYETDYIEFVVGLLKEAEELIDDFNLHTGANIPTLEQKITTHEKKFGGFADCSKVKPSICGTGLAPKNHEQEKKPQLSLIPMDLMEYVARAYEEGLLKYYRDSWRNGFKTSTMIDAARRHISAFWDRREDFDPDAAKLGIEKHHIAGAIFSLLCILDTHENHPELDDRREIIAKTKS